MLRRHAGNDPKAICVQSAGAPVRAAARPVSQPPTPGRSAAGDAWNCAPLPAESRVVSGRRVSDKNGLKPCLEATKKRLHHNVLAIALANERAGIACSIRWNGCRKFCFDLIVAAATTSSLPAGRAGSGEIPIPQEYNREDPPRSGERRTDAGCGRERDPGGRHPHVDKTIRHARNPVDRAKPTHLPGNALYLSWRRRLARRLIRATIPECRRYAKLNDIGSEEAMMANALSDKERALMDAYWRAANYLSVGQIYLYDNPLLKQPLTKDHIKPRLLGHWGTTPGLNFIYVHLNRVIKKHDLDMIYITGPGHGGPGLVANAYL